jgi:antitoxin MazE
MKTHLIPIGNSRGVRIPKAILEQCEMPDEVELSVEGRQIILRPVQRPVREGWREAAAEMAKACDDELLIPDVFKDDATVEWQ